ALALKRASGGGEGIRFGPGQKVIKWFLLYRIDMDAHRPAIDEAPQPSLDIHARAAFAPFTVTDYTSMGAEETSHFIVFVKGCPVTRPGGRPQHLIYGITCESDTKAAA
ncbi:MAG TPA: hypothetical protein VLZ03_09195, partial [Thermodesulfobacteriota bacterium]|nr:hypothetical protein [Thermodesulfobacteriota bacterium]